ncbi:MULTISPECIES: histidinol-phosphate transaminase [Spirulina sp. CCY15215]|uniref:histidinol-phosphate transaminase n=1 Tax=Spirulina sp. CCY15215 TaxID=2767591 RepID=UPI0019517A7A|nr:histidinol-phosphate transaminase [Spirulina major]
MFNFLRSDLANLKAYNSHLGDIPKNIDRLNTNESPYDLPAEFKEKLAQFYQNHQSSNRYPDGNHAEIKTAIAEYVNESAQITETINIANISLGNGSDELIRSLLMATCLNREGSILVANPTFSIYAILAKTLGIPSFVAGRSPDTFEIDLEEAEKAIATAQNPPIRVVFVVHPNSPTANTLTAGEIEWLKSIPEEILVVIDEAYFEFSQTSLVGELPQHPNWAILRTFSKAFRLASLRVGYAIAHPEIIIALEKVRLPYNLSSFSLAAAKLAIEQRELLLNSIPQLLEERDRLFMELSKMPQLKVWPSQANFLYISSARVELKDKGMRSLAEHLKQRGTLLRYTGEGLRITVGTPAENQHTLERIHEIVTGNW